MGDGRESGSFTTGKTAQEIGLPYVPECYTVPASQRPTSSLEVADELPVIDIEGLMQGSEKRALVVREIGDACRLFGFFQVTNHGIGQNVLDDALSSASDFFKLPASEKMKLMSSDVHEPVRYSTSLKDGVDKVQFWRVLLKHYAYPLEDWLKHWPSNPPTYREKMGNYCKDVRKLALELMRAIVESLGLCPNHLTEKLEAGMQVMAVNCYPACPTPEVTLGLPPHSDYSCLTVLLQSSPGLEISGDKTYGNVWRMVPHHHGVLQVHVGDHFEVMSNGDYKSVIHRASLHRDVTRVSVTSLHSLGEDEKMGPAEELVDGSEHPKKYRESSFKDFLDFLAENDIAEGKTFISTLKI